MSGFQFSMPEPRPRDGWFRIGTLDVTTSGLVALVGLASMVLYAIDRDLVFEGVFSTELVRQGEVWRLVTWPLVNPPSIWELIGLAVFWLLGNLVEEDMGRKPFAWLLLAMTVIPAAIVTLLGVDNDPLDPGRWQAVTYSVSLLTLAIIVIFALEHPGAKFFFGIPAWVIAAAFVFIEVVSDLGDRAFAQLILVLLVIAVGCIGARQRGLLDTLTFIPRIGALSGPRPSPYGELGATRPKPPRRPGRGRGRGRGRRGGPDAVVSGPWNPRGGPTPLEQAELDVLLDRISEGGIDSLTKQEKQRLNELSRRMRD